jgi:hypothetical protein
MDTLQKYCKDFANMEHITLDDMARMKAEGISTEIFLNALGETHNYLFHGSRNDIPFGEKIISKRRDVVFASSKPVIAILKAIYLNNAKNLGYPLVLDNENKNLTLVITEAKEDTVGEKGYVYCVEDKTGFEKDPRSNWQFSKGIERDGGVPFVRKIEVEKKDFDYPVLFD